MTMRQRRMRGRRRHHMQKQRTQREQSHQTNRHGRSEKVPVARSGLEQGAQLARSRGKVGLHRSSLPCPAVWRRSNASTCAPTKRSALFILSTTRTKQAALMLHGMRSGARRTHHSASVSADWTLGSSFIHLGARSGATTFDTSIAQKLLPASVKCTFS
jgi:hypothetical protein